MPPKPRASVDTMDIKPSEDIIVAILDQRVQDSLVKALTPALTITVEKCLNDKLSEFLSEIKLLKEENVELNKRCSNVETKLTSLKVEIAALKNKCRSADEYSHRDNLVIQGLHLQSFTDAAAVTPRLTAADLTSPLESSQGPERNDSAVVKAVLDLFNVQLNVPVKLTDISAAHRLGSSRHSDTASASSRPSVPSPIIVRFTSKRVRDEVFRARKQLKSSRSTIFINEHLTSENSTLFRDARQLLKNKKLFSTWSFNGSIYIKLTENFQPKRVFNKEDLPH